MLPLPLLSYGPPGPATTAAAFACALPIPWLGGRAPTTAGPVPEDILSGVRAVFLASASAATLTAMYSVKADDDAEMPYAVVREARVPDEVRFSDVIVRSVYLEVTVYAPDLDAAGRLGDGLKLSLLGQKPEFAGASVGMLTTEVEPAHGHDPGRARGGDESYWQRRDFRVRVVRGA